MEKRMVLIVVECLGFEFSSFRELDDFVRFGVFAGEQEETSTYTVQSRFYVSYTCHHYLVQNP